MKGSVAFINPSIGFFAVMVENNDYTVIETSDIGEFEIGDIVSGNLNSHGDEKIKNITKDQIISVYIQSVHSTASNARGLVYR